MNAIPHSGGVVYIPAGGYNNQTVPAFIPPLILPPDRPLRLLGDGSGVTGLSVSLDNTTNDLIIMAGNYQSIEGLSLSGPRFIDIGQTGPGVGVRIKRTGSDNDRDMFGILLRDVAIRYTADYGLVVDGSTDSGQITNNFSVWAEYHHLEISDPGKGCVWIQQPASAPQPNASTTQYFTDCIFQRFRDSGIRVASANGVMLRNCIIQGGGAANPADGSGVNLTDSNSVVLDSCWFENLAQTMIVADGTYCGLAVRSCLFVHQSTQVAYIELRGTGKAVEISNTAIIESTKPSSGHHVKIGQTCEAVVSGGSVRSDTLGAAYELDVDDQSLKSVLSGAMWRLRLPVLTVDERDALTGLRAGDMVTVRYTRVGGYRYVVEVWDDSIWRPLW